METMKIYRFPDNNLKCSIVDCLIPNYGKITLIFKKKMLLYNRFSKRYATTYTCFTLVISCWLQKTVIDHISNVKWRKFLYFLFVYLEILPYFSSMIPLHSKGWNLQFLYHKNYKYISLNNRKHNVDHITI